MASILQLDGQKAFDGKTYALYINKNINNNQITVTKQNLEENEVSPIIEVTIENSREISSGYYMFIVKLQQGENQDLDFDITLTITAENQTVSRNIKYSNFELTLPIAIVQQVPLGITSSGLEDSLEWYKIILKSNNLIVYNSDILYQTKISIEEFEIPEQAYIALDSTQQDAEYTLEVEYSTTLGLNKTVSSIVSLFKLHWEYIEGNKADGLLTYNINSQEGYIQFNQSTFQVKIDKKRVPIPLKRYTLERRIKDTIQAGNAGWEIVYDWAPSQGELGQVNSWTFKDYLADSGHIYEYQGTLYTETEGEVYTSLVTFNYCLGDIFLTTKDCNLCIKYDPEVSGVKFVTDDAVTKTLGGRYPIVRRNGHSYYRQFNINGLISIEAEADLILEQNNFGVPMITSKLTTIESTDYSTFLIKERAYRDKVLDFLYNDKIKYFKSSTEGAFPVYLTGISLTPNKTLSRGIYSFSAQATEVEGFEESEKLPIFVTIDEYGGS